MKNLLLSVSELNWGIINVPADPIVSRTWKVFSNGDIEYQQYRAITKEGEHKSKRLTSKEMRGIRKLIGRLNAEFVPSDTYSQVDGTGYRVEVYDGKEVKYLFVGYIEGKELLEDTVQYVKKIGEGGS